MPRSLKAQRRDRGKTRGPQKRTMPEHVKESAARLANVLEKSRKRMAQESKEARPGQDADEQEEESVDIPDFA